MPGKDQTDPAIQAKAFISLFNLTGINLTLKLKKPLVRRKKKSTVLNYSIKVFLSKKIQNLTFCFPYL